MLSEDEKKALKLLEDIKNNSWTTKYIMSSDSKKADTVLSLIKQKDKQIDLMAQCIDKELSSARLGELLNKNVNPLETYKEDIKQYFERKVNSSEQN